MRQGSGGRTKKGPSRNDLDININLLCESFLLGCFVLQGDSVYTLIGAEREKTKRKCKPRLGLAYGLRDSRLSESYRVFSKQVLRKSLESKMVLRQFIGWTVCAHYLHI